jgi:hypothetical protein
VKNKEGPAKAVERLFPFVLRSRNLMVGRETLGRNKSRLHFVLITLDISEQSRAEVLSEFAYYPVVQLYTSAELEQFFGVKGTKVIGFQKSGLAQSIYAELKQHRLNKPVNRETALGSDSVEPGRPKESPQGAPSKRPDTTS